MYSTVMLILNTQKGKKKIDINTASYQFIIFMHFGLFWGGEGGGGAME